MCLSFGSKDPSSPELAWDVWEQCLDLAQVPGSSPTSCFPHTLLLCTVPPAPDLTPLQNIYPPSSCLPDCCTGQAWFPWRCREATTHLCAALSHLKVAQKCFLALLWHWARTCASLVGLCSMRYKLLQCNIHKQCDCSKLWLSERSERKKNVEIIRPDGSFMTSWTRCLDCS